MSSKQTRKNWFETDKDGLAKLVADRPKSFIVYELLQNGWDEDGAARVDVTLEKLPGRPRAVLTVADDAPEGFKDLSHAFTMFATSYKKDDPNKRGRFNLGEKLVLALCDEARIETTTGTVVFDANGRHRKRAKRAAGSVFTASLRMNQSEFKDACAAANKVIPPSGILSTFNGHVVKQREPLAVFEGTLPTVLADVDGTLRQTRRKTRIEVYEPWPHEEATIYEMGIPVVGTGDCWHVNVQQKVPLNMDRDNVTPAYLRKLRTLVLNHMHEALDNADAASTWVHDAMGDKGITADAVKGAFVKRFGENAVVYDPSDPEANNISTAEGRPVIYGGSLNKAAWQNVKKYEAALPAGKVTPSDPGKTEPAIVVPKADWSEGMVHVVAFAQRLARKLIGHDVAVKIIDNPNVAAVASYGSGRLMFNVGRLGRNWFDRPVLANVVDLLIHEFGHEYEGNHLSSKYYDALTRLGAKATVLALEDPGVFCLTGMPESDNVATQREG